MGLTAGTDILTGTAADDTYFAGSGTLNSFDQVDAGAGVDTLRVEGNADITTGDLTNFERFDIVGADGGAGTYDVSEVDGLEQLWFVDSGAANEQAVNVDGEPLYVQADDSEGTTVTDTPVIDDNSVSFSVDNLTAGQTVGAEDSFVTLNLGAATDATTANVAMKDSVVQLNDLAANGTDNPGDFETLNVTSEGDSSLAFGSANDALRTVNVAAAGALTLSGNSLGSAADQDIILDASASTGNLTVESGVVEYADSVMLGAGDDTINVSSLDLDSDTLTLEGGAGNDTLVVDAAAVTALGTVGGASVSGFETLGVSGGTLDANTLTQAGFSQFAVVNAAASAVAINNVAGDSDIRLVGDNDDVTFTVAGAADSDSDSLGFTVVDGGNQGVTVDDVENINISTVDTNASDEEEDGTFEVANVTLSGNAVESVSVTGDEAVYFDGFGISTLESVDVSGVTAESGDLDSQEFATTVAVSNGVTVTGSAGADLIAFGLNSEVTGGEGADTFTVFRSGAATNSNFATVTDFQSEDSIIFPEEVLGDDNDAGSIVIGAEDSLADTATALSEISVTMAPGETATFNDYLASAGTELGAGDVGYFEFSGNTYVAGGEADFEYAADTNSVTGNLVELTGSVDLSNFAHSTVGAEIA